MERHSGRGKERVGWRGAKAELSSETRASVGLRAVSREGVVAEGLAILLEELASGGPRLATSGSARPKEVGVGLKGRVVGPGERTNKRVEFAGSTVGPPSPPRASTRFGIHLTRRICDIDKISKQLASQVVEAGT